jgi:hypothetical protein
MQRVVKEMGNCVRVPTDEVYTRWGLRRSHDVHGLHVQVVQISPEEITQNPHPTILEGVGSRAR